MEVLHPNPVDLVSGSHSMASPFPSSNFPTTPQAYANYVPFFDNNTQTNFPLPSNPSLSSFNSSYGVFPSPTYTTNNYFVNNTTQNSNVFFGNNFSSWNNSTSNGRRGIKRKSMEADPEILSSSQQKKTRSRESYESEQSMSTSTAPSLPTSDDSSSKQIILYQGPTSNNSNNNNGNHNFLRTLFESNPINFFPDHVIDPETQKALIQVGKPTNILSVWDTPDDSEPERELIKSPRIVELTEDDLDTGEEHIRKVPQVLEADSNPKVTFPTTPPTSPPRTFRTSPPREQEPDDDDEEVIVDELNNVFRSKPKANSNVVIEEVHDEPLPADTESFQGMDIE